MINNHYHSPPFVLPVRAAILPTMPLTFRRLTTDSDITAAFPLALELRPHLKAEEFISVIRRQEGEGYCLYGADLDGVLVTLAGVRVQTTLHRGRHLFVDDLVTGAAGRGKGYGQAMLGFLGEIARLQGITRIYLDSRDTAVSFYKQVGFTFLTSVPCWIDVAALPRPELS